MDQQVEVRLIEEGYPHADRITDIKGMRNGIENIINSPGNRDLVLFDGNTSLTIKDDQEMEVAVDSSILAVTRNPLLQRNPSGGKLKIFMQADFIKTDGNQFLTIPLVNSRYGKVYYYDNRLDIKICSTKSWGREHVHYVINMPLLGTGKVYLFSHIDDPNRRETSFWNYVASKAGLELTPKFDDSSIRRGYESEHDGIRFQIDHYGLTITFPEKKQRAFLEQLVDGIVTPLKIDGVECKRDGKSEIVLDGTRLLVQAYAGRGQGQPIIDYLSRVLQR